MEYKIIRSRRKTLSISVKDAEVTVHAPKSMPSIVIEEFVRSKSKWIESHQVNQKARKKLRDNFCISYGDTILYLGKTLTIEKGDVKRYNQIEQRIILPPNLDSVAIKKIITKFYKDRAKEIITGKVKIYSEKMALKPSNVRITGARTRWGSCSGKANVNLSWYLVMASEEDIDYVVIHELSHLKEMNHSEKFWTLVGKYVPDYKERRSSLRRLNERLLVENWKQ